MTFKAPPVVMISGSEAFLRDRHVRRARLSASASGWDVEEFHSKKNRAISQSLISASGFFKTKRLVVVKEANKIDVAIVKKQLARKKSLTSLVLVHNGEPPKKGSFVELAKLVPQRCQIHFASPKPWEREDFAVEFVRGEAERSKTPLDDRLARALVSSAGDDLGILSWEVRKASMLAKSRGLDEITVEVLKGTASKLSEAGTRQAVDALACRNVPRLVRMLGLIRSTHGSDPTMKMVGFFTYSVLQWMQVAALLEQGKNLKEVANLVRLHEYRIKTQIAPPARKWGYKALFSLYRHLVKSRQNVLHGALDPWTAFEAGLIQEASTP